MPGRTGLELLPEIRQVSPLSRIIMISGYADKTAAIEALRGGAFDFLEKPFNRQLFAHSVGRALEVLEKEIELHSAREQVESTNRELRLQKNALEQMKSQLIETNEALSVLARNLDTARVESERRTALMAKSLLLPIVQRLRNNAALSDHAGDLELLSQHIRDLAAEVSQENKIITTLSRSELRVAALVRNGMTNDEIAERLNVSTFTIKTHRRNIRKKLKLNNAHINLRSYLANHLAE
jgi:FixJ family two-component response regulator